MRRINVTVVAVEYAKSIVLCRLRYKAYLSRAGTFLPKWRLFPSSFFVMVSRRCGILQIDYINVSPLFPMTMIIFFSISPASTAPL